MSLAESLARESLSYGLDGVGMSQTLRPTVKKLFNSEAMTSDTGAIWIVAFSYSFLLFLRCEYLTAQTPSARSNGSFMA